jgi:hypothetical protein
MQNPFYYQRNSLENFVRFALIMSKRFAINASRQHEMCAVKEEMCVIVFQSENP